MDEFGTLEDEIIIKSELGNERITTNAGIEAGN